MRSTDYYPFGLQMPGRVWRSDSETREGYTGHELDPETGLNYAGARYYDSALARWHVIDPLWAQFPNYSPYNYVLNNPISMTDPDGKAPCVRCDIQQKQRDYAHLGIAEPRMSPAAAAEAGKILVGLTPAGVAIDVYDFGVAADQGDWVGMGLATAGFLPVVGDVAKKGGQVARELLTGGQASNLRRFEKKLPAGAEPTVLRELPNGSKAFQADVPASNIPGSKASYEKQVDAQGNTLQVTKTTYAPDGSIVHTNDKISGETHTPESILKDE